MRNKLWTKRVGWMSIASGLGLLIAPIRFTRRYGLIESKAFGRVLGIRDILIGMGVLRGKDMRLWLRLRAVADIADSGIMAVRMIRGGQSGQALRVVGGLVASAMTLRLAQRYYA